MMLPKKLYDVLKYIQRIFLPALITFYGVFAEQWGLTHTVEIVTTAIAFTTFLGAILEISSANYQNSEGGTNNDEK